MARSWLTCHHFVTERTHSVIKITALRARANTFRTFFQRAESAGRYTTRVLAQRKLQHHRVDEHFIEVLDEHWGSLILRLAMVQPANGIEEFQAALGIPLGTLNARLGDFVRSDVMNTSSTDERGDETVYTLTEKGRDLAPIVTALDRWNERWSAPVMPFLAVVNDDNEIAEAPEAVALPLEISMLGTFVLRLGGAECATVPVSSQRLLAYLSLKDRAVGRLAIAGTLWPDATELHAGASLRSALTRLDGMREAVVSSSSGLRLAESVTVDFQSAASLARRLLQPGSSRDESDLSAAAISALSFELLPDWYDDWVVDAAEDWRQTRMNALEVQARMLIDRGRLAEAAGVAQIVIRVEPLRESAHALLIRVHLAEGNQSAALREFGQYRKLLLLELGLEPTALLSGLVADIDNR